MGGRGSYFVQFSRVSEPGTPPHQWNLRVMGHRQGDAISGVTWGVVLDARAAVLGTGGRELFYLSRSLF